MQGLFQLKTVDDLRKKLRRDLEKLKANPLDADLAFNFFVTAEHMLDWVYPGSAGKTDRTNARKDSVLLQVCSHVANGAKHFEVESKHHKSVSSTDKHDGGGYFAASFFPRGYFPSGYWGGGEVLSIKLENEAASQLGSTISVLNLADKIMAYWDEKILTQSLGDAIS